MVDRDVSLGKNCLALKANSALEHLHLKPFLWNGSAFSLRHVFRLRSLNETGLQKRMLQSYSVSL